MHQPVSHIRRKLKSVKAIERQPNIWLEIVSTSFFWRLSSYSRTERLKTSFKPLQLEFVVESPIGKYDFHIEMMHRNQNTDSLSFLVWMPNQGIFAGSGDHSGSGQDTIPAKLSRKLHRRMEKKEQHTTWTPEGPNSCSRLHSWRCVSFLAQTHNCRLFYFALINVPSCITP